MTKQAIRSASLLVLMLATACIEGPSPIGDSDSAVRPTGREDSATRDVGSRADVGSASDVGTTDDARRPAPPTTSCPYPGQVAMDELCNAFDDDCDGIMDEGVCDDPCNIFDQRGSR